MVAVLMALVVLLVLTFKKVSVLIAAPISVILLVAFSGLPVLSTVSNDYMSGIAGFIQSTWLLILLGALFGKLMDMTGAARSIAELIINTMGVKRAVVAVVIASGLLTYGGVASMVVVFALYPITLTLFKKADLPRVLIPAAIGSGAFTFANMLPGNPQTLNIIPTTYLGTTAMAAPAVGIIAAVSTFAMIILYFKYIIAKYKKMGIGFVSDDNVEKLLANSDEMEKQGNLPNPWVSLIPPMLIVFVLNVLKWNVLVALLSGCIICGILFYKNLDGLMDALTGGASGAALTVMNVGAIIGMGSVIKITPGFQQIVDIVLRFSSNGGNPLAIFGAATSVLCGVNASGVGGLSIALGVIAEPFLNMGVNPELLHRIGVIAGLGLDSLPHSGGIVTLLIVTGISYKDGYKHLFVTTVLITTAALVISIICGNFMYPV